MNGFHIVSDRRSISNLLPVGKSADEERVRDRPARGIAIGCVLGVAVWMMIGLIWLLWF